MERNLQRMSEECAQGGVALRPHAKGHKSPYVAHRQRKLGAVGICTAKIGEAEVMVEAGVDDILVTTVATPPKIDCILSLAQRARIICVVDDAAVVEELGRRARAAGIELETLVDVNVGQNRTGVEPGQPTAVLSMRVAETRGLVFKGLQGYEGHLQHVYDEDERRSRAREAHEWLTGTAAVVKEAGLNVDSVTTAGTGTYQLVLSHQTITEVQPGSYVMMDANYARVAPPRFENALFVLAGVVSTNRPGQYILDAGWKALSTEDGMPTLRDHPVAHYSPAGDEHGRVVGLAAALKPGDLVHMVPSHCDTTVNLYDRYILVDDADNVLGELPVAARGRGA